MCCDSNGQTAEFEKSDEGRDSKMVAEQDWQLEKETLLCLGKAAAGMRHSLENFEFLFMIEWVSYQGATDPAWHSIWSC